jgi:hypothetical protein
VGDTPIKLAYRFEKPCGTVIPVLDDEFLLDKVPHPALPLRGGGVYRMFIS